MRSAVLVLSSSLLAAVLVIAGLWMWQGAGDLVLDWDVSRPEFALWCVRGGAVAAIAAAQVILLELVGGRLYGRGTLDTALTAVAVAVFAMASVSAVACGLAGR